MKASTTASHPRRAATLTGLAALLIWSAYVGLVRTVAQEFGATLGAALLYTLAAIFLWITRRPRNLRTFPRRYLLIGGGLFVFYEVAVSLAIGFADGPRQAVEVSIVNHLWPTLTVLLTVVVSGGRRRWMILPGLLIATAGVVRVVGGGAGLTWIGITSSVGSNPLPYAMALAAAFAWACYSVFAPRLSSGHDGITLFMSGVAVALWLLHVLVGRPTPQAPPWWGYVALVAAAAVIAAGYACWNVGIAGGNMLVLAVASYSGPVLQGATAAAILGISLTPSFWQGVVLVVCGSLLCWWTGQRIAATREPAVAMTT